MTKSDFTRKDDGYYDEYGNWFPKSLFEGNKK